MTDLIKEFILSNENSIEVNDWEVVYTKASLEFSFNYEIGEFTEYLIAAGIDPLEYMDRVPPCYLCSTSISECTFPENIKYIGASAYANTNIKELRIPSQIKKIYTRAFTECDLLETVYMQTGITGLSNEVFSNCYNLKNINFPPSLREIGDNCFFGCKNLPSEIYLTEGLEIIRQGAFVTTAIEPKTIFLPKSLRAIEKRAFDPETKLVVHKGSYAHEWVQQSSYEFEVIS